MCNWEPKEKRKRDGKQVWQCSVCLTRIAVDKPPVRDCATGVVIGKKCGGCRK